MIRFFIFTFLIFSSLFAQSQGSISLNMNITRSPVKPNVDPNANDPIIVPGSLSGVTLGYTQAIKTKQALTISLGSHRNIRGSVTSTDYRWASEYESGTYVQDSSLFHNYFFGQRLNYYSLGFFYSYLPFNPGQHNLSIITGTTVYFKLRANGDEYFYADRFGSGPGSGFKPTGELDNYKSVVPTLYLGGRYNFIFYKSKKESLLSNLGLSIDVGLNYFISDFRTDLENDIISFLQLGLGVSYRIIS